MPARWRRRSPPCWAATRRRPTTPGHRHLPERRRRARGRGRPAHGDAGRPQPGHGARRPYGLGGRARRHPTDLRAHRRDPRRGVLQRWLHRQREPRAGAGAGGPVFHKTVVVKGSAARSGSGGRAATTSSTSRAAGHPARFDGRHAGGRGGAHVGAQGGRQAAGQPVLRGRLQGHAAGLGDEPRADRALASCAAGAAAPRRPRRSSATSRATGRARSVRRASTARPPSGARSGWSRTAAPAP
jgi:hypothetical protein